MHTHIDRCYFVKGSNWPGITIRWEVHIAIHIYISGSFGGGEVKQYRGFVFRGLMVIHTKVRENGCNKFGYGGR